MCTPPPAATTVTVTGLTLSLGGQPLILAGTSGPVDISLASRSLAAVDLAPLAANPDIAARVVSLSLAANGLGEVDLAPLAACKGLVALNLSGNGLRSVDLEPLGMLPKLERVWLNGNQLETVDLSPLAFATKLTSLYLEGNNLNDAEVDLRPLKACRSLKCVRLARNRLAGALDVAPLLGIPTLLTLDVNPGVQLVARVAGDEERTSLLATLPAAFRRRAPLIRWMVVEDEGVEAVREAARKKAAMKKAEERGGEAATKVMLVGFESQARIALTALLGVGMEVSALPFGEDYEAAVGEMAGAGVVDVVVFNALERTPEEVTRLRRRRQEVLIVVVGGTVDASPDTFSLSIRRGADAFLMAPLSTHSVAIIHDKLEKKQRATAKPGAAAAGPAVRQMMRSGPVSLLLNKDGGINFEKLRARCQAKGFTGGSRSRVEESGIKSVFNRCGGRLSENEFNRLATLIGLPVCAASFLFEAVEDFVRKTNAAATSSQGAVSGFSTPNTLIPSVSYTEFSEFYAKNLKNADGNTRLFSILCRDGEQYLRHSALETMFATMIESSGGHEKWLPNDCSCLVFHADDIARCFVATVTYKMGVMYGEGTLSLKDFRSCKFNNAVVAAESGAFTDIMASLCPREFRALVAEYRSVFRQNAPMTPGINLPEMRDYVTRYSLVTPRCLDAIYSTFGSPIRQLTLAEFIRFSMAVQDLGSLNALAYFFPILDNDHDGFISLKDMNHFYSEKCRLVDSPPAGESPALDCVSLWQIYVDALTSPVGVSAPPRAGLDAVSTSISKGQLKLWKKKDREEFMRETLCPVGSSFSAH